MKRFVFLAFVFLSVCVFSSVLPNGVRLRKVDFNKGYIQVNFDLPEFNLKKVNTKGGVFTKIVVDDFGYSPDYGKAMLPTCSFSVMLNSDTLPSVNVVSFQKEVIKIDAPVFPVQKPWPKSRRIEDRPFTIDHRYYKTEKPAFKLITVEGPYIIRGKRGATVTIHPFQYFPKKNVIVVYTKLVLRVNNAVVRFDRASIASERIFSKIFLNYFKPDSKKDKSASMGRILIITPSKFADTLAPLVDHKTAMGYSVDVFTLDDTGSSREQIHDFIAQRYSSVNTRPDFVILVGDTGDIPAYVGSTEDNPYTDLYYSTVDGNDYFPDVSLGRLSVLTEGQLTNMINKIVYMESSLGGLPQNAVFITADDNYQITEGTHNYVIDNYFEPNNYDCQKLYYHTYGATKSDIANAVNSGKIFVVYSGHGSPSEWYISYSTEFTSNDVNNLLSNTVYPFVYSFACQTGEYEYSTCYGEAWVRGEHGACAFWGSSVYSYWDEDDVLEREIFKSMFVDSIFQVGPMFNAGKIGLYNHYNGGGSTLRYFQQYNLFGDPSTYTKSYHPISMGQIFLDKEAVACGDSIEVELWDSDLTEGTIDVTVEDLLTGDSTVISLSRVDEGKYTASITPSELFGSGSGLFEVDYHDANFGGTGDRVVKREFYMDCEAPYPVYFRAYSNSSTSGKLKIKFNEECSIIHVYLNTYPEDQRVEDFVVKNTYEVNKVFENLEPDKRYSADIWVIDTLGNSFSQIGAMLFKTIQSDNVKQSQCDSEDDFTHGAIYGNDVWAITTSNWAVSNGTCWFGAEKNTTTSSYLLYGPVDLGDGDYTLSFYHTYHMEYGYDGGLVEISTDGGNTFVDAGPYMMENGYNSVLEGGMYEGRLAFTGGEFGTMKKTVINLSPFKGKSVYIRFICSSDPSVSLDGGGWYIDNISVDSVTYPDNREFLVAVKTTSVISMLPYENTNVTADLYDSNGGTFPVASRTFTLSKDTAVHTNLGSIFDGETLNDNTLYTVVFTSNKRFGLYLMDDITDSRGDMRNWTEGNFKWNKITVPVPHIAPEINYWDTLIQVANVGMDDAEYGLAYSPLDVFMPFDRCTCHPYASRQYNVIHDIFNDSWPDYKVNMANVLSTGTDGYLPVCATEVFEVKNKANSCKLTLEQSLSKTLYVAHIDNSDYWWTGLAIINPDRENTAVVEVVPFDMDGNELDNGRLRFFLNPGEHYAFVTKDVLPLNAAWLRVDSDIPVMGYELFGTMNRKLLTGVDLIDKPSVEVLLPVIDSTNDWTGITIINPFNIDNNVKIMCYYQGTVVHEKDVTLDGFSKWVGLLSDIYSGDVDMVKVVSDHGIVSFCLEGNGHDDSTMTKLGGVKGFEVY